jgi:hypothetical protein
MNNNSPLPIANLVAPACSWVVDPFRLVVGEVYDSGVRRWPGQELILTTEGCLALVTSVDPTPAQVHEFRTAEAYFAWVETRHNGILVCRFGTSRWQTMSYNPHRDTPDGKSAGMPAVAAGQRLPVAIGFAGGGDDPVLAVRTLHWPEHFVSTVAATVRRLLARRFDAAQTRNESNCLYLYVRDEKLVERAVSSVRVGAAEGDNG